MFKTGICETASFIQSLVESYDSSHSVGPEVVEVVFRGMQRVAIFDPALVVGPCKG